MNICFLLIRSWGYQSIGTMNDPLTPSRQLNLRYLTREVPLSIPYTVGININKEENHLLTKGNSYKGPYFNIESLDLNKSIAKYLLFLTNYIYVFNKEDLKKELHGKQYSCILFNNNGIVEYYCLSYTNLHFFYIY